MEARATARMAIVLLGLPVASLAGCSSDDEAPMDEALPRDLVLTECRNAWADFPVPVDAVAAYLPQGFEADQPVEGVALFNVNGWGCQRTTDAGPAEALLAWTYVTVRPPPSLAREGGIHHVVLSASTPNPGLAELLRSWGAVEPEAERVVVLAEQGPVARALVGVERADAGFEVRSAAGVPVASWSPGDTRYFLVAPGQSGRPVVAGAVDLDVEGPDAPLLRGSGTFMAAGDQPHPCSPCAGTATVVGGGRTITARSVDLPS